jgi:hypothetical protein
MLSTTRIQSDLAGTACRALLLLLLALGWIGCGTMSMSSVSFDLKPRGPEMGDAANVTPHGPGHVFSSVEAAAMDALAYCYLETRQVISANRRARGGSIFPTDGGFSYDEPAVARDAVGRQLRYRLRPTDVAHYRHYAGPSNPLGRGSLRGLPSKARRFVDRRDPISRPFYYLTPERFVSVYGGAEYGEQTLARLERGARRGDTEVEVRTAMMLASADPSSAATDQPLALQPVPGMPGSMPPR